MNPENVLTSLLGVVSKPDLKAALPLVNVDTPDAPIEGETFAEHFQKSAPEQEAKGQDPTNTLEPKLELKKPEVNTFWPRATAEPKNVDDEVASGGKHVESKQNMALEVEDVQNNRALANPDLGALRAAPAQLKNIDLSKKAVSIAESSPDKSAEPKNASENSDRSFVRFSESTSSLVENPISNVSRSPQNKPIDPIRLLLTQSTGVEQSFDNGKVEPRLGAIESLNVAEDRETGPDLARPENSTELTKVSAPISAPPREGPRIETANDSDPALNQPQSEIATSEKSARSEAAETNLAASPGTPDEIKRMTPESVVNISGPLRATTHPRESNTVVSSVVSHQESPLIKSESVFTTASGTPTRQEPADFRKQPETLSNPVLPSQEAVDTKDREQIIPAGPSPAAADPSEKSVIKAEPARAEAPKTHQSLMVKEGPASEKPAVASLERPQIGLALGANSSEIEMVDLEVKSSEAPTRFETSYKSVNQSPGYRPATMPVHVQHIAAQIFEAIPNADSKDIQIKLSPEELGGVRIVFSSRDAGGLTIYVERPETLELMRRHESDLSRQFQEFGAGQSSFSFQQERGETDHDLPSGHPREASERPDGTNTLPTQPNITSGTTGVDIRL